VISLKLQLTMIFAVIIYFILLLFMLRRNSINLKYTLLWIFSGMLMLILAIFPRILDIFSALIGIHEPVNALFAVLFFCVIIILMSLTAIVSKQNYRIKKIAQVVALLEKRIRDLEGNKK